MVLFRLERGSKLRKIVPSQHMQYRIDHVYGGKKESSNFINDLRLFRRCQDRLLNPLAFEYQSLLTRTYDTTLFSFQTSFSYHSLAFYPCQVRRQFPHSCFHVGGYNWASLIEERKGKETRRRTVFNNNTLSPRKT